MSRRMMTPAGRHAILRAMRGYKEEEWRKVRAAGKRSFLLKHGFLGRGLPMGFLTALVIEYALGGTLPEALGEPAFLGRLLLAVAVFTLSGSVAANANWNLHERRFTDRG